MAGFCVEERGWSCFFLIFSLLQIFLKPHVLFSETDKLQLLFIKKIFFSPVSESHLGPNCLSGHPHASLRVPSAIRGPQGPPEELSRTITFQGWDTGQPLRTGGVVSTLGRVQLTCTPSCRVSYPPRTLGGSPWAGGCSGPANPYPLLQG